MLDGEEEEKLALRFGEPTFDLLASISSSTYEGAYLFVRLIREHPEKFQKSTLNAPKLCAVPLADNRSHKRT